MAHKYSTRILILASIVIFGALLRFYLASHAYPFLVFDSKAYVDYAQEFLGGSFPLDPRNKNMGYPFFIAIIFWLRGASDIEFVKIIQIVLDLGAGICVWIAAKRILSQKTADIALLLYLINPFTSSYTGIILPEVISSFLVGMALVLSVKIGLKGNIFFWFFIGFALGLILFVKSSLLFFALGAIVLIGFLCFQKEMRWKFLIISFAGFLIASSYTLIINYRTLGKIAVAPPYSTMFGQTYVMSFYAGRYPEVEFWGVAPELIRIMAEYEQTPNVQIPEWNRRYLNLFMTKAVREPVNFLSHYLHNMFWLWDKDHLSVYEDPWYPEDRYPLRIINWILLGLGICGLVRYLKKGRKTLQEPFVLLTVALAAIMSLQFPLVSNESRHTIPFYPLLIFWAAYGMGRK